MGQEARCTVRFGERVGAGKALLETDELVFRGDDGLRLKLAFKEMRSVEARDGELRVVYPDGPAVFQLGPEAEKWAQEILHPKSLLDKLGVKAGMRVLVLGVDDEGFWRTCDRGRRRLRLGRRRTPFVPSALLRTSLRVPPDEREGARSLKRMLMATMPCSSPSMGHMTSSSLAI
jgi:hypothetical protein